MVVGQIGGPAAGVGDGSIQLGVHVGEPRGVDVVEAGEGASGVCGAPVFAELVEFAGGVGDGFALFG